jgi:hypothetical protein
MKRPQFGIRLMLLVVTLFATIFAWKRAVETKHHAELEGRIMALQEKLYVLQQDRAEYVQRSEASLMNQSFHVDWNAPLPIDSQINAVRLELKTLKPD